VGEQGGVDGGFGHGRHRGARRALVQAAWVKACLQRAVLAQAIDRGCAPTGCPDPAVFYKKYGFTLFLTL
jgi:hypothetical protein